MTANPWRGEVEIILDGKAYILRPTFSSLSNVEQKLGTGLIALAKKLAEGESSLEELVVIITQCASETSPDIRESLVDGDLAKAVESISQMFAMIFGGADEA